MSGHTDIRRGGFDEVILYTGAGDVHSVGTRLKGSGEGEAAPAEEVEYFEGGDGHDYVQRREWAWAPVLVAQRDVEVVERWRREGKRIGVIGIGPVAALWRELVPIRLEDAGEGRGSFSGRRLRLRTRLLEAAVARSPDLFGGVQGEAAEGVLGQRWRATLPLGGRLLCIDADSEATLRIFDASGAQLGEVEVAHGGDYVTLPGGTHTIEIDAEGRRPRVHLDRDNFALTLREADGGGYQLRAYGDGRFVLAERVTRTDRSGTTRTLGWRYRLLPEGQGRRRIRRDPENGTTSITHDT